MYIFNMLKTMVGSYTPFEALVYDSLVAPAVVKSFDRLLPTYLAETPIDASVLDVGCGGGQLLLELAKRHPQWRLTGLDLSPGQIARANKRAKAAGAKINFVQGSALALPFAADSFDAVISVASLKHWPDAARGLAEIYRVLKPGGRMWVFEVDRGCSLEEARQLVASMRFPKPALEIALALFRTYIAGRSQDLEDARALAANLPTDTASAARVAGTPAFVIAAKKPVN